MFIDTAKLGLIILVAFLAGFVFMGIVWIASVEMKKGE